MTRLWRHALAATLLTGLAGSVRAADPGLAAEQFHREVEPVLSTYCYDCHGNGSNEGSVTLDEFASDEALLADRDLWWRALRMVRADMMPPADAEQPPAEDLAKLERWIKSAALEIDPEHPDPGRVTVRRLNRAEYRNTIRDLMDVDFDVNTEFPPDDTGHGFDNMGDVLTLSPLLLEKYMAAAESIVAKAVPMVSSVVEERRVPGARFRPPGERGDRRARGPLTLSYYEPATAVAEVRVENDGKYLLQIDLKANEVWVNDESDLNRCRLTFHVDGEQRLSEEFSREESRPHHYEIEQDWGAGAHELSFQVEPLTKDVPHVRSLSLRVAAITLRGPIDEAHRVAPPNYERFFPRQPPADAEARRAYAAELLGGFATRAFRKRVDQETAERLAALAESIYSQPGQTFEAGVAQAMAAVLASPRFLYREESIDENGDDPYPLVDEYALASRLSYFLWSSMPDEELIGLAREHKLRANLHEQVERMMADRKFDQFIENYAGQWLRARDVETALVDARAVLSRENPDPERDELRQRFRRLQRRDPEKMTAAEKEELRRVRGEFQKRFGEFRRAELSGDLRRAMRRETEMAFECVVREDRSLLDLVDADYAFLNEDLAKHYGIEGVDGEKMRRVDLPDDSPRGGVLTQGTALVVTSNPDRTSPAKRGLYVLEAILGTPPPPPPPNIPSLEQAETTITDHAPTSRELLELHRADPLCSSCHNRMDPLGLALENFNALGLWRDEERKQPIDATGQLITGDAFKDIRELKRVLVTQRKGDIYRCATEKMLTYALGRGLEYYDVEAVDQILARLEAADGHASALMLGIIESAPFQRTRRPAPSEMTTEARRSKRELGRE